MQNGVIYVAEGPDYLDLALASVASLRALNPGVVVDLFTDQAQVPEGLFDAIHPIPADAARAKVACMALSRFDRTLFLDCDTLALGPMGDLFDLMDRFDLAATHDMRRASDLIREGFAEATPYAFPQLNTGVLLYRRSAAMAAFLAEWDAAYRAAGVGRDQVTFKDLLWRSDIRFYVLPTEFNLRRTTLLDAWEPLDALPVFLHSHRLVEHLRRDGAARITSVDQVVALERAARAAEWADLGLPDPAATDAGIIDLLHRAEALARQP